MYATFFSRGLSLDDRDAPTSAPLPRLVCGCVRNETPQPQNGEIGDRLVSCHPAEITGASIFGSKICQHFAKTPKNEGKSVDIAENKGTKSVTLRPSVDVYENKGR